MPILRGCCCFDLKTGSKIIGIVILIMEIIGVLAAAGCLILYVVFEQAIHEVMKEQRKIAAESSEINSEMPEEFWNYAIANFYYVKVCLLVTLALQLLDIIAASCLIHGINTNRRGFILPFIVIHCLFFIIELGTFVLIVTAYAYVGMFHGAFVTLLIIGLLWLILHIYLILVVISEHQALGLILMHSNDDMCMK